MKKYHLFNDFGVYKQTLKNNFYDNDREADVEDVRLLLDRRTQSYTLAEIRRLFLFLWTAHDDCVVANREDYNPLQYHASKEKIRYGERVLKRLEKLERDENDWRLVVWTDEWSMPVAHVACPWSRIEEALNRPFPIGGVAREEVVTIAGPLDYDLL